MNKLYLLYAVILLLALTIISVFFQVSIGTIISFFWFAFVVIILLNIGAISRTLKPILRELLSKPFTIENLLIALKAIYDVNFNRLTPNLKPPSFKEAPESNDSESTAEVDATINEVLAEIDKQEQAQAPDSRQSNKAARPDSTSSTHKSVNSTHPVGTEKAIAAQNSASGRPKYVEISDLLKDLIGQKDSVNQKLFRSGEKVYICIRCQSGYHEDSWQSLGCTCKQCGTATKVREYTLPS